MWVKSFSSSLHKKLERNHFHEWKILPQTKASHGLVGRPHRKAGRLQQLGE